MPESVSIRLLPSGKVVQAAADKPLLDVLFAEGVEFPCGGRGRCKGCRVKVLEGEAPVTDEDTRLLGSQAVLEGWRLACQMRARSPLTLELAQWEAPVLADDTPVHFTPREGLGIAIDLGTTTIVAQLLDLRSGHVLAVRTAWNNQARYGADIMSRIEVGAQPEGRKLLTNLIRSQIQSLILELLSEVPTRRGELVEVTLVGNTAMHHLFCDLDVSPLAHAPFEPDTLDEQRLSPTELGWSLPASCSVRFLACLGGFVGSDIMAGIQATRLHETERLSALVDLGTNGEIVVGNCRRLLCASTAAGPAFEGARISMGMRAATGAIVEVHVVGDKLHCHVLGGGPARGICGSGLVDAVAAGLDLGWIEPSGRLHKGRVLPLIEPVHLTQRDIRELQLAKGAIAAGLRLLVEQWGARMEDLETIYLAGAFGNYIRRRSARRIGLFHLPPERIVPAGNTALRGAKTALCLDSTHGPAFQEVLRSVTHVPLNEDPRFEEVFVEEMRFPTG